MAKLDRSSASADPQKSASFEDQMDSLFEELALAVQWERPSILIAVYESEFVRAAAETFLQERLDSLGQGVIQYQVNSENYDIPLILAQRPDRSRSVFFIHGIRWGGGKGGYQAYRALNLHREYLVEASVRVVFWLTQSEAMLLPRHAPDFWAFRHRVIEIVNFPARKSEAAPSSDLTWGEWGRAAAPGDVDGMIAMREELLASLPKDDGSLATHCDLLYSLAFLYWIKKDTDRSSALLKQGLSLSDRLMDPAVSSRFWTGLGILENDSGHIRRALAAFEKAVQLNSNALSGWQNLAILLHASSQDDLAVQACEKAINLQPDNADTWDILANIYLDLGRLEEARKAGLTASRSDPSSAKSWKTLGLIARQMNRTSDAIRCLNKASRLDPGDAKLWGKLGDLYQDLHRYREAAKAYRRAIDLDAEDSSSQVSLTACLARIGPRQNASREKRALASKKAKK